MTSLGTTFKGNTEITSFNELGKFTGVTALGENDNSAGHGSFTGCSSLKELTLPRNCEVIGVEALANCTSLEKVNGFEKIKTIKNRACYNSLLSQDLRLDNVEGMIPYMAFYNTSIKSVYIGDKVTSLEHTNSAGQGVFGNCVQLRSVRIPASLNIIGGAAFYNCTALKEIIGDMSGVTAINSRAFAGCTSLEIADLSIPNLETIGDSAFSTTKIKKVSNLGNITTISGNVFNNCTELTEFTDPISNCTYESKCFTNCTSLTKINIRDNEKWFRNTFKSDTANPIRYAKNFYINDELVDTMKVPSDLTTIGNYVLWNWNGTTVDFGNSAIETIGS